MESHQAQPAAPFVGSPCRRGPTCLSLPSTWALSLLPSGRGGSVGVVGRRDQPPDGSVLACLARLERVVEQILAIFVPQITKDIATMSQHAPAERVQMTTADRDQPGDQVRRDSAAVHRQGCPSACCDATTGFSPPFPRIQEQIVEVAKIIPQRRISERIVVKTTDVPVPQILTEVAEVVKAVNTAPQDRDEPFHPLKEEIHEVIKLPLMERILERTAEHIVQVPVPQILKEVAEVVKAVKNVPQERIPEKTGEPTTGPSDTDDFQDCESPAGAVHRRSSGRACCDTATGPSVSNCVEDSGSPEERIPERIVEHTRDVPVPQIHEQIVEYVKNIPQEHISERTTEQTCIPADTVHRQGCCRAYCDTATGPSVSDCAKDG